MTSASIYISSASGTPSSIPNAFSSIASGATGHISDHQNIVDALFYHDYYLSTSSGLRAAIADDTGTGSLVFNTSPNFTGTPTINGVAIGTGGGGTASITIADEGTNLTTNVGYINFTGAGVTATGTSSVTVTIPGGGGGSSSVAIQNSGTLITNAASVLNFTGTGITSITNSGGSVTITTGSSTSTFTNSTLSGSTTNSGSIIGGTLLNSNMVGASTTGSFYMNANGFNDTVFYLNAPNGSQPYYVFQSVGSNLWGMTVNATNTVDFQLRRMNGTTFNAPAGGVLNWPTTPYAMTISGSTGAVVFPGNSLTIANAFTGAPQNQLPAIPPYAGTFEYDGTAGYFTPNITASSRGVIPTELLTILTASAALPTAANTNQNVFPSRNTITLAANTTYEIQMELAIGMSATGSAAGGLRMPFEGTASPYYSYTSTYFPTTSSSALANNIYYVPHNNAYSANGNFITTLSSAISLGWVIKINGFIRTTSSGTFIPKFNLQSAPTNSPYLQINSYMKLIPIGASATTGTVAWS